MKTLGVDCGDVIFYTWGRTVPGSLDALRTIVRSGEFEKVVIVSQTRALFNYVFLARLWYLNFWEYTGIPRENIHFCRQRKQKGPICKELGVTHFVDDRLEVLSYLYTVDHRYAFNPHHAEELNGKYADIEKKVTIVRSWAELVPLLIPPSVPPELPVVERLSGLGSPVGQGTA